MLRNIERLNSVYDIMSIEIPSEQYFLNDLIHQYFPSINVTHAKTKHAIQETTYSNSYSQTATHDTNLLTRLQGSTLLIIIPSNSILHFDKDGKLVLDEVNYPWDFLKVIQQVLNDEVTSTKISSNAKISKTSIIEGPCIIEKGVVIDDFCKIKGPVYIGENSFIGMGSLVRNSILERNTRIGFNCEIGKSYFAGNDKISHHNVILDTLVGQNVWFGGYSGTANVLLDRRNIRYEVNKTLVDTGLDHFGSVVGNNCCIGASVIILPGRKVLPNSQIQAGTIVRS
jgi:UDP-N-acetylglucosamine diphosphorylase / glucose-1-phosphate thymidylyltransferase / UDP-N-acetylgalactosamine diphosphorylase / glucosamine-1-phosphate N-acetyltransferase / galactosamine-1-phosphate N-acetyltransferase